MDCTVRVRTISHPAFHILACCFSPHHPAPLAMSLTSPTRQHVSGPIMSGSCRKTHETDVAQPRRAVAQTESPPQPLGGNKTTPLPLRPFYCCFVSLLSAAPPALLSFLAHGMVALPMVRSLRRASGCDSQAQSSKR